MYIYTSVDFLFDIFFVLLWREVTTTGIHPNRQEVRLMLAAAAGKETWQQSPGKASVGECLIYIHVITAPDIF